MEVIICFRILGLNFFLLVKSLGVINFNILWGFGFFIWKLICFFIVGGYVEVFFVIVFFGIFVISLVFSL